VNPPDIKYCTVCQYYTHTGVLLAANIFERMTVMRIVLILSVFVRLLYLFCLYYMQKQTS